MALGVHGEVWASAINLSDLWIAVGLPQSSKWLNIKALSKKGKQRKILKGHPTRQEGLVR